MWTFTLCADCKMHIPSVFQPCSVRKSTKTPQTPSYHWKSLMMTMFCTSVFLSACVLRCRNYPLPLRTNKVHCTWNALVYGKWLTTQCQQLHCCILGSNNANDIVINSADGSTSCLLSTRMNCYVRFMSCSQVSGLDQINQESVVNI